MNTLNNQLRQITLEAFESLCQIFPITDAESKKGLPLSGAVSVGFSGPVSGRFSIWFYGGLPLVIAEAMLGETPSAKQGEDAMKEMANVLCGNILPYVAGPELILKLEPPQLQLSSAEAVESATAAGETCVAFPGGSARMAIFLTTPAATLSS